MKPEYVAAMTPGPETGRYDVTSCTETSKVDEKRNMTPRLGMLRQGKSAMQNNPARVPLEMTNAIRRRRQTSDIDYWHTVPPGPQTPKPLYRAVLRGALGGDNTVCTLSSIVDAANDKEYNMIIKRNSIGNGFHCNGNGIQFHKNVSVIRAEDMGLTISGLSINEIRSKPTGNMTSPRNNGYNNKVTSVSGSKQRKLSGQNNSKIIPTPHINNGSDSSYGVDHDVGSKTDKSKAKTIALTLPSAKPVQKSPRLGLTSRQSAGDFTDAKKPYSPRSEYANRNTSTSLDLSRPFLPHKNTLLRQSSLPLTSNDNNGNSIASVVPPIPMETSLAKRKFSQEVDNCKKKSSQNSQASACIQFADSILNAVNADLDQVYSICQAKVRYAEFIEHSQPHRLGEQGYHEGQQMKDLPIINDQNKYGNPTKDNDYNNDSYRSNNPTKELSPSSSLSSSTVTSSSSSSPPSSSSSSPSKPFISRASSNINANSPPFRLAPLATRSNKYIALRNLGKDNDNNIDLDKPVTIIIDSSKTKMTRPILKSSKTDIDNNLPSFRQYGDKTDSNNNTSMGNRLVRFKVNHEVREFAPSEPVRYP